MYARADTNRAVNVNKLKPFFLFFLHRLHVRTIVYRYNGIAHNIWVSERLRARGIYDANRRFIYLDARRAFVRTHSEKKCLQTEHNTHTHVCTQFFNTEYYIIRRRCTAAAAAALLETVVFAREIVIPAVNTPTYGYNTR